MAVLIARAIDHDEHQGKPDGTRALTSHYQKAVAFPAAGKCPIKGNGKVGRDEEG